MEALFVIGLLLAFGAYFAGITLSIVLLIRVIRAGIACIKLSKFPARNNTGYIDTYGAKKLWIWILALSIFFALALPLSLALMDVTAAATAGFVGPPVYLQPQLGILVGGKIILGKYSKSYSAYKMWERRQSQETTLIE